MLIHVELYNNRLIMIFIVDSWPSTPQKVIVPGSVTSASVQNLQPATSYHLRIIAENRLGQSEPSQLVQVTTTEEGIFISGKKYSFYLHFFIFTIKQICRIFIIIIHVTDKMVDIMIFFTHTLFFRCLSRS